MTAKKPPFQVRSARVDDAPALAALLHDVFAQTYGAAIPSDVLQAYLARQFSPDIVAKSLTCAGAGADTVHLIAEANSGKAATFGVIGFAKTIARPVPHHETLANVAEIEKFYVASAWHGRGVAVGLLAGVVDAARARNWQNLWLCVWQHNARALAFYRKHGFRCIDTTQVLVDGIVFDDDVLLKSLKI